MIQFQHVLGAAMQQQRLDSEQQLTARLKLVTTERDQLQAKCSLRDKFAKGQGDATEKLLVRPLAIGRPGSRRYFYRIDLMNRRCSKSSTIKCCCYARSRRPLWLTKRWATNKAHVQWPSEHARGYFEATARETHRSSRLAGFGCLFSQKATEMAEVTVARLNKLLAQRTANGAATTGASRVKLKRTAVESVASGTDVRPSKVQAVAEGTHVVSPLRPFPGTPSQGARTASFANRRRKLRRKQSSAPASSAKAACEGGIPAQKPNDKSQQENQSHLPPASTDPNALSADQAALAAPKSPGQSKDPVGESASALRADAEHRVASRQDSEDSKDGDGSHSKREDTSMQAPSADDPAAELGTSANNSQDAIVPVLAKDDHTVAGQDGCAGQSVCGSGSPPDDTSQRPRAPGEAEVGGGPQVVPRAGELLDQDDAGLEKMPANKSAMDEGDVSAKAEARQDEVAQSHGVPSEAVTDAGGSPPTKGQETLPQTSSGANSPSMSINGALSGDRTGGCKITQGNFTAIGLQNKQYRSSRKRGAAAAGEKRKSHDGTKAHSERGETTKKNGSKRPTTHADRTVVSDRLLNCATVPQDTEGTHEGSVARTIDPGNTSSSRAPSNAAPVYSHA